MIGCLESLTVATLTLLGELPSRERLRGAAEGIRSSGTAWPVLKWFAVGVIVIAAIAALAHLAQRLGRQRKYRGEFEALGAKAGLGQAQMKVLSHMAKALAMTDAAGLFTSQGVFDRGVISLMQDEGVMSLPPKARAEFGAVLESIRRALGFTQFGARMTEDITSTRQITAGTPVQLILDNEPETIEAQVDEVLAIHLAARLDHPVTASPGQIARLRVPCGPVVWEFDVRTTKVEADRMVFDHSDSVRMINRRRFPRVATTVTAYVAPLPFVVNEVGYRMPEFVEAELEEIAGPGMLLLGTWQSYGLGDKALLAIQFNETTTLQGVAKIRRVEPLSDGAARIAVEMVSLNTEEMAELVRQTNYAMTAGRRNASARTDEAQLMEAHAWTA